MIYSGKSIFRIWLAEGLSPRYLLRRQNAIAPNTIFPKNATYRELSYLGSRINVFSQRGTALWNGFPHQDNFDEMIHLCDWRIQKYLKPKIYHSAVLLRRNPKVNRNSDDQIRQMVIWEPLDSTRTKYMKKKSGESDLDQPPNRITTTK